MDVTQLALTWLGWPNGEKVALTCVQIWSPPKWAQVIASQRKCTQGLAKWSRKLTQVFNLRLLATPFDPGLTSPLQLATQFCQNGPIRAQDVGDLARPPSCFLLYALPRCKLRKTLQTCDTPPATWKFFHSSSLHCKLQEKLFSVTWP